MSDQTPTPPTGYIQLELMLDVDSLTLVGIEYMEDAFDEWERNPGNPDTIMIEGAGQMAGEVYDQASQMPPEAMTRIGTSIYNIPMEEGTPASAMAHFTFDATAQPGLIDADTWVSVPHPSGENVLFVTLDDILISPSVTIDMTIVADAVGSAGNGAFGNAELIDPVLGLESILVDESADGTDAETALDYLNRLSTTLTTLTPRPVLPADHALLVGNNVPGVGRVTAIDLLCPGTTSEPNAIRDPNELAYFQGKTPPQGIPTTNLTSEPRCTTVAIVPTEGGQPSQALKQAAWDYLNANREVNFLNYVIGPTYTTIDVKAEVHAYPGFTQAEAISAAKSMIETWLSPATFGSIPGPSSGKDWAYDTLIRHDEAVDYLNRAPGVFWTRNVQLKKSTDGTWSNGDITIGGLAPLPMVGDLSGITAV